MFSGTSLYTPFSLSLNVSGQSIDLLLDVNSADTYILKDGVLPYNKNGYDVDEADFIDLKQPFTEEFDSDYNFETSKINGTLGVATISKRSLDRNEQYQGSFGLVTQLSTDFSKIPFSSKQFGGRVGVNTWLESKTNASQFQIEKIKHGVHLEVGRWQR